MWNLYKYICWLIIEVNFRVVIEGNKMVGVRSKYGGKEKCIQGCGGET